MESAGKREDNIKHQHALLSLHCTILTGNLTVRISKRDTKKLTLFAQRNMNVEVARKKSTICITVYARAYDDLSPKARTPMECATNQTKSNCNQITIEHCLELKMGIIL